MKMQRGSGRNRIKKMCGGPWWRDRQAHDTLKAAVSVSNK